ncbi:MAG TPA: class I SAM-dependent methyltransferase [Chloroflexota bacterium]
MKQQQLGNVAYYERLATYYSLFISDPTADAENEIRWLRGIFAGRRVRTVLDAGCGTGRHAIPLALAGFEVTAADPCGAMLGQARTKAKEAGASIRLVETGFAELAPALGASFDAVILLGNSLCNLSSLDAIREALRGIHGVCASHTVVVIGIKDFETILRSRRRLWSHRCVEMNGAKTVLYEVWSYDDPILMCTAVALSQCGNAGEWSAETACTREYMLTFDQLTALAHDAGFAPPRRVAHPNEARFLLTPQ